MQVIRARNVAEALPLGLAYLLQNGVREDSRNGPVLVAPGPVTTCYSKPQERVLLSPLRDANPFFHLAESLWMLAGRRDAKFLDNFVRDFGVRFAEKDGDIHGAYGYRWRKHFQQPEHPPGHGVSYPLVHVDQLSKVMGELRENPASRQVVLTMWDPAADLGVPDLRDRPCNTHVYFRVRDILTRADSAFMGHHVYDLDMTVLCRSNDIIMGAYGANAVHFSVLQEYLAAQIGVGVGTYYQVSNNFHVYQRDLEMLERRQHQMGSHYPLDLELRDNSYLERKVSPARLVDNPATFDGELRWLLEAYETVMERADETTDPSVHHHAGDLGNKFLSLTAWPMLMAHHWVKRKGFGEANRWASRIEASDWRRASKEWIERRERAKENTDAKG